MGEVGLHEAVDDLARVLLLLDLFVEVVEEVGLVGHGLIQVVLKPLRYATLTFFSSFSGDFRLESRLMVIILLWYSFFRN